MISPTKTSDYQDIEAIMLKAVKDAGRRIRFRPIREEVEGMMSQLTSNDPVERETAQALLSERYKLLEACETDSYIALLESVGYRYHETALEMVARFITENNCTTTVEKMQAEIIVGAFIRTLNCSRRLTNILDDDCMVVKERLSLIALLSKQLDLTTHQFHAGLWTFKHWRMPALSLNIKTNNAFVAQNIKA